MRSFLHTIRTIFGVFLDALTFIKLCFRPTTTIVAENLFLRKQLGLLIERKAKPCRATDTIRFTLARLSRLFDWRSALTIVKRDTLIRWHRKGFPLLWKWKSRPRGRPRIPADLRKLIVEMATNNPTWGEERIADELLLKIGIFPTHRPTLHAQAAPAASRPEATLDDVCAQSRQGRHCL